MNLTSNVFKTLFLILSTTVFTNCFQLKCYGPQNNRGHCFLYMSPCEEIFQKMICPYLPKSEKVYLDRKLEDSIKYPGALFAAEFGLRSYLDQQFLRQLCSACGYHRRCRRTIILKLTAPSNIDSNSHRRSSTSCNRSQSPCRRNSTSGRRDSSPNRRGSTDRRRGSSPSRKGN